MIMNCKGTRTVCINVSLAMSMHFDHQFFTFLSFKLGVVCIHSYSHFSVAT